MIDLSLISPPDIIEELDFETILTQAIADLQSRDPAYSALVESDPAYKILEVAAYRELLLRQRINEAARANMLAQATGNDLDNFGANPIYNVERLLIDAGDLDAVPPVPPTYEDDERYRYRIQLAMEAISTAGASGSYEYQALSASTDVLDVDVSSPSAGQVTVTVLSAIGDGTPDQSLLDTVEAALSAKDVRPLTDQVTVAAPTITNYTVDATLYVYAGPDQEVTRQAAEDAVTKYVADHHRLGHDITESGLYAALHQPGVQRVELTEPATLPISVAVDEAAYCTSITVTVGGVDE